MKKRKSQEQEQLVSKVRDVSSKTMKTGSPKISFRAAASTSSDNLRKILDSVKSPDDFIEHLKKAKRIVVITGAGISVSYGIPDFRSKGTGLYESLDCAKYGIPSAELLFDLQFFLIDPDPFYRFAKNLIPRHKLVAFCQDETLESSEPTSVFVSATHKFIADLDTRKKLLRNYSQNIDGLELIAGINPQKLVQCHGSIDTLRCTECNKKKQLKACLDDILSERVPRCACKKDGIMKPEITFFGEVLPDKFFKTAEKDVEKADLVIVVGTSLKVGGSVVEFLRAVEPSAPQILINNTRITIPKEMESEGFDLELIGDCDMIMNHLGRVSLGWELDERIDFVKDSEGMRTFKIQL